MLHVYTTQLLISKHFHFYFFFYFLQYFVRVLCIYFVNGWTYSNFFPFTTRNALSDEFQEVVYTTKLHKQKAIIVQADYFLVNHCFCRARQLKVNLSFFFILLGPETFLDKARSHLNQDHY
jgi:hypothetical protein